jgi:hypothetical protein
MNRDVHAGDARWSGSIDLSICQCARFARARPARGPAGDSSCLVSDRIASDDEQEGDLKVRFPSVMRDASCSRAI